MGSNLCLGELKLTEIATTVKGVEGSGALRESNEQQKCRQP